MHRLRWPRTRPCRTPPLRPSMSLEHRPPPNPNDTATNTAPNTNRQPKPNPAHPAPSRNDSDPTEWQQVKRPRTRKTQNATPTISSPSPTTLQRSSSRGKKPRVTNKFSLLDFEILPTFDDDNTAPIEIALPVKPSKPPRRKYRDTKRAITKPLSDAAAHTQQIRHPAHMLQHMSPKHSQVILRSTNPTTQQNREKLIQQIALLRAARANATPQKILLDGREGKPFLEQVRARVDLCKEPPSCTHHTPTDIPLNAILDQDELRVRGAVCFARIDLATRAKLPHLYDMWPDPPAWNNYTLKWLPARDDEVPCLQEESLAALAACPTLQNVWAHIATTSPELSSALNTAANQWNLYLNSQAC